MIYTTRVMSTGSIAYYYCSPECRAKDMVESSQTRLDFYKKFPCTEEEEEPTEDTQCDRCQVLCRVDGTKATLVKNQHEESKPIILKIFELRQQCYTLNEFGPFILKVVYGKSPTVKLSDTYREWSDGVVETVKDRILQIEGIEKVEDLDEGKWSEDSYLLYPIKEPTPW